MRCRRTPMFRDYRNDEQPPDRVREAATVLTLIIESFLPATQSHTRQPRHQ